MEGEGRVEAAEQIVVAALPTYCCENAWEDGWLGLTQKQLAELMGCSQQYVSKVLKGQENLSLETMSKIEDCLHISFLKEELEMA